MDNLNKNKKSFKKFNAYDFIFSIVIKWAKFYRLIFGVLFLVAFGYILIYWFSYVANYKWTESRKQEYVNLKKQKEEFNEAKFYEVIKKVENNEEIINEKFNPLRNIFGK